MFKLLTDECGIVAQVSAPLAHAEISTYYICTYFTDQTLVSLSTHHMYNHPDHNYVHMYNVCIVL